MGKRINEREGEGRKRGGRGGILKENIEVENAEETEDKDKSERRMRMTRTKIN